MKASKDIEHLTVTENQRISTINWLVYRVSNLFEVISSPMLILNKRCSGKSSKGQMMPNICKFFAMEQDFSKVPFLTSSSVEALLSPVYSCNTS